MISGFSGLPKFRQLVAPIGRRAGARHVARRLGDRQHRALARIEIAIAAVAIGRHRQRPRRALDADDAGAHPGEHQRIGAHHVVVLAIDPALAGDGRRREQRERMPRRGAGGAARPGRAAAPRPGRPDVRSADRRPAPRPPARVFGISATTSPLDFTRISPSSVTTPMCAAWRSHLSKIALDLGFASPLDDEQHALLRFREHDLVRRHPGLPLRDVLDVDLDAGAAARAHFARRAGQPGGAHVLDADQRVGRHQLETRLEQQLLHERIADLHRRPLLRRPLVELRRRHRRAVDPVAPGLGADVVHRIADARRRVPFTSASALTMPRHITLTSGLPA